MSLLTRYSLPAERARDCVFIDIFEDTSLVVENGGTITGTPVIDFEFQGDGSSYIVYDTVGFEDITTGNMAIVMRFRTGTIDGTAQNLISQADGTGTGRTWIGISSNNKISTSLSGTFREGSTTLQSNTEYITSFRFDGSTVKVYLDGVEEVSASDTIDEGADGNFIVGANKTLSDPIDNEFAICDIRVFKKGLTVQEHLDYASGALWNYLNEADLHLPMKLENHDPTNSKTLDVSSNGFDGTLVNGPTKLTNTKGYRFNGTNQEITLGDVLNVGSDDFSLSFWVKLVSRSLTETYTGVMMKGELVDGWAVNFGGTSNPGKLRFRLNDEVGSASDIFSDRAFDPNVWVHVVLTAERDSASGLKMYLNTIQQTDTSDGVNFDISDNNTFRIGNDDLDRYGNIEIAEVKQWQQRILTPMIINDINFREEKQFNDL